MVSSKIFTTCSLSVSKNPEKDKLPDALADTLTELNRISGNKIIVLNKYNEVIYPAFPFNKKNSI